MATITIKIESEQLAREVLTQLGYLGEPEVKEPVKGVLENLPEITRTQVPKQSEFCKEDVEPDAKEIGAPLGVYSDDAKKERDAIYKQFLEVSQTIAG